MIALYRLLCKIGLHHWKKSRPLLLVDVFPPDFVDLPPLTRTCMRCDKRQKWLPGYGGSEVGCWIEARP
jgi:hypothetical protein